MTRRWQYRPEGSNWGEFGDDDRLGRLNLLTPARRLAAVAEVRAGLSFCLSLPLEIGPGLNPSRLPPRLSPALSKGRPKFNFCACTDHPGLTDVINDDAVKLYTQFSTQWDALCHAGSLFDADGDGTPEVRYYNGYGPADEPADAPLGLQHMAASGVQGRGVLIDLEKHYGPGRTVVSHAMLMDVLARDGVVVETGDMVCLHTGYAQRLLELDTVRDGAIIAAMGAVLDGHDRDLHAWITASGLAVLVADNVAVEGRATGMQPGYAGALMPLHEHCLFKLGVHLGELWLLSPLAHWLREHGRYRFLLTAPPLRLRGAVGSPVTPVATV